MSIADTLFGGSGGRTSPVQQFYLQIVKESLIKEIRDASKGDDRLEFSDIPSDVVVQKSAQYSSDIIPGRTEPWVNYSYSQGTIVTFTGKLVATGAPRDRDKFLEMMGTGLGLSARFLSPTAPYLGIAGNVVSNLWNRNKKSPPILETIDQEVHQKIAWIEALTHAQYDSQGRAYPPPLVYLKLGENFIPPKRGILTQVTFTYHGPWDSNTLLAYYVDCVVTFQEVNIKPRGYIDVRNRIPPTLQQNDQGLTWKQAGQMAVDFARTTFGI